MSRSHSFAKTPEMKVALLFGLVSIVGGTVALFATPGALYIASGAVGFGGILVAAVALLSQLRRRRHTGTNGHTVSNYVVSH